MSQFSHEHPEDWKERLEAIENAVASGRCPHGESHWKDCEVCVADERGVRIWERSRDK